MRINKWNGLTPASSGFSTIVDDLFNSSFSDLVKSDFTQTTPSVNIIEVADAYQIEVAAPGLEKADFDVKVDKDQLIISAETKVEEGTTSEEKETSSDVEKSSRKGFNYSTFKRSFHLTDKVDAEGIDAVYKDGILTVTVSKKEEAIDKEPTVIEIK